MALLVIACLIIGFVAGVAEATRVINAVDRAASELHTHIKLLREELKGKL